MNAVAKIITESGRDKDRWIIYSVLFTPIITGITVLIMESFIFNKQSKLKKKEKRNEEKNIKNYKNVAIMTFIYSITALITSMFGYFNNSIDVSGEGIFFSFISLIFSIYIFANIKEIINEVYGKMKINSVIYLYIIFEIFNYFAKFYIYVYNIKLNENVIFMAFAVILTILQGVIGIVYGRGIKRVTPNSDFKMYGNFLIISSIFSVTVLGYFISGILNAIAYFYLSIIFKNNERALEENDIDGNKKEKLTVEAEKYFNKLNLIEYDRIKQEAVKYLPKALSEEEKRDAIINYIAQNCMWQ
jgi:hypothetical protein